MIAYINMAHITDTRAVPTDDQLSGLVRLPRPPRVPRIVRHHRAPLPPLRPPPLDVLVTDLHWLRLGDGSEDEL